ncbi:oxepin-CoA hydrolase/3-oxo-5,6-dehydrosuberyl-CoA semialdehyde dehydrogenase [Chitinophaga skermanii]|uniref:Oxepin-CoA hydrolase/3-oxo-5,6-dehydrosuberyl-CoA semialdehyde dehydrogenase n=1 Tax=Chitinophaga skermanii TaxID=331697 RepID=A0A327Q315_9BACT|nr:hypothetical protein [Chitinophaga skermanii]RAI98423.1 oxepin-CoA hydrolase/3-oxo-5,6-dehydrosuberyl-CoA semialdehyde dehydrogenase [Chitinophaga skermanii]
MTIPTYIHRATIEPLMANLQPTSTPIWGGMTPQHMIEHLTAIHHIGCGSPEAPCFTDEAKLPTIREFLRSEVELRQGVISPIFGKDLHPYKHPDLATAKLAFLNAVDIFHQYYQANPGKLHMNPVFGQCSYEDWQLFHKKHNYHHFKQFGLV